ncbi:hypothetical protein [Clostridium cellulovorans]|uniref:Uncharacterized protein n=1 Tax=Clostridium cellulovorans (strain ATCC 35296 / DSM 3052 / OCM 3 / 743B) TaxID=573061 RepID=D9SLP2_CLOC7|nr:hypothetical protein [Clostridium cellulovorans]ADL53679.1 hypothetical protein Clocel_4016 [Clostridium cellulovorans 743B]
MALNFANLKLEVIDITSNSTPEIYVNNNGVTFSKRVLEDLGYPQYVQFYTDPENKVFAVRPCKGTETKATSFAKAKTEQKNTLSITNKNLREVLVQLIPNFVEKTRYKIVGEYDAENKIMLYDMSKAEESSYRTGDAADEK